MLEGYRIYQMVISSYLWLLCSPQILYCNLNHFSSKKKFILKATLLKMMCLPVTLTHDHHQNGPAEVFELLPLTHLLFPVNLVWLYTAAVIGLTEGLELWKVKNAVWVLKTCDQHPPLPCWPVLVSRINIDYQYLNWVLAFVSRVSLLKNEYNKKKSLFQPEILCLKNIFHLVERLKQLSSSSSSSRKLTLFEEQE